MPLCGRTIISDLFERVAAQHARGRQLVGLERRDAVAVKDVGQRAQIAQVHAGAVQQHALGGRIGQQHVAIAVDHQHRLRHAAERALEHGDRQAQLVMRGDQMLGALGDGGLERFLGGLRLVQRALELSGGALALAQQHGDQQQDHQRADEVDAEQHDAGAARVRRARGEQPFLPRGQAIEIGHERLHEAAAFGLAVAARQCRLRRSRRRSRIASAATSIRRSTRGSVAFMSAT